jgi:hypothetical protein
VLKCQQPVQKRPLQISENNYSVLCMLLIVQIDDSCIENPLGQITWNISTEFQVGMIKIEEKIATKECTKH